MAEFCYQCTEEHFGDGAKNDFVMSPMHLDMNNLDTRLSKALCEGCRVVNKRDPDDLWTIVDHEGYCVSHRCRTHNPTQVSRGETCQHGNSWQSNCSDCDELEGNVDDDLEKLHELYNKINDVCRVHDKLVKMEKDTGLGMDLAIMESDYFRPAVKNLVDFFKSWKVDIKEEENG